LCRTWPARYIQLERAIRVRPASSSDRCYSTPLLRDPSRTLIDWGRFKYATYQAHPDVSRGTGKLSLFAALEVSFDLKVYAEIKCVKLHSTGSIFSSNNFERTDSPNSFVQKRHPIKPNTIFHTWVSCYTAMERVDTLHFLTFNVLRTFLQANLRPVSIDGLSVSDVFQVWEKHERTESWQNMIGASSDSDRPTSSTTRTSTSFSRTPPARPNLKLSGNLDNPVVDKSAVSW